MKGKQGNDAPLVLDRAFFEDTPLACARNMIGCELVWQGAAGIVVETEAYTAVGDEAAHTFMRTLARSFVVEKPAGALYVYLNYGIHWLLNFLVRSQSEKGFVLVRALEPTRGVKLMESRRKTNVQQNLCSGPGKLTQALAITGLYHGADFFNLPRVYLNRAPNSVPVRTDRRIGITKSVDFEWRFLLADSGYVSVPIRKTRLRTS
jgi:DNA-3-methyladenine glycosylase